jgi:flagellar M-ring protein FliF
VSAYLQKVFKQISDFFQALPPLRRVAVVGTGLAMIAGVAILFALAGKQTFQPLMSNLNPEDAANIMRVLREKRVPYQIDDTGRNISVPPESVYDLRLELAAGGVVNSGTPGYEIFDKTSLGQTSFVQKINQKRALEGEIMRSINTIRGVRRSRVHLAIPQKSAFVEDQRKPTASVVLDLEGGVQLNEKQIFGVGNLVARAVEGMDISDVAIVDSQGRTLSRTNSDPLSAATASQLDYRQKVEQDMEKRIEEMLARVVGEGRVVARVSADLDFSQVSETQTLYDQEGAAIRSVQKDNKSMEGSRPGPSGAAGATTNLPQGTGTAAAQVKSDTKVNAEVVNYEVPQTIRKTNRSSGGIKKLSVAVVVDGKSVKVTGADGAVESKVEAWPADKLKEFETIVLTAAGIDKARGDTLEVKNMEFTRVDFDDAESQLRDAERKTYMRNLVTYGLVGLLILLFFFLVVRPFIKWVTDNTIDSVDSFLPQTIEELERLQKNAALPGMEEAVPMLPEQIDPEKVEGEMIKEKIISLVDSNPHKAALILRDWVHEDKGAGDGGGGGKPKSA